MSKIRLKDIAREVGVSVGAVGWVLNGMGESTIKVSPEKAELIKETAKRMGYEVNYAARQLRGGTSGILGIITHEGASAEGLRRIIEIEQAAAKRDLYVMVAILQRQTDAQKMVAETIRRFEVRGVDGLIALPWHLMTMPKTLFKQLPVVFVGPASLTASRAGVGLDAEEGGRLGIRHLLEQGRRRIGFLLEMHEFATSRLQGSRQVMEETGHAWDPNLVLRQAGHHFVMGDSVENSINRLVDELGADAIVCENDHWAARVLKCLQARGISVPGQVAILGYNNLPFCEYMHPTLSSLEEQETEIAQAAVDILVEQIQQPGNPPRSVIVQPKLIVRQST